jgi:hypothetical protein
VPVRVFQDSDFVFAHTEYDFFGPKIGFDIFRFEEGLIVEHWDNLHETASHIWRSRNSWPWQTVDPYRTSPWEKLMWRTGRLAGCSAGAGLYCEEMRVPSLRRVDRAASGIG